MLIVLHVQKSYEEFDPEFVKEFWNVLALCVDDLELMVELNPAFKDGVLFVSALRLRK